jgi:hypothetical protein
MPDFVLLEDVHDLADFLEATKRTVRRASWAEESIAAANMREVEGLF